MKIRTDFVTNSSSSSFILGFKSEEEIPEILRRELPSYWTESIIQSVIDDTIRGIVTKQEAIDEFTEYIPTWNLNFKGKKYWDLTSEERESREYLEFVEQYLAKYINKFVDELEKYNVVSIVEYADDSSIGNDLEHNVMPYLGHTIRRISNH